MCICIALLPPQAVHEACLQAGCSQQRPLTLQVALSHTAGLIAANVEILVREQTTHFL